VDRAHEQIAHPRPVRRLIEECVLAVQNRLLQSAFGDVVVEGRPAVEETTLVLSSAAADKRSPCQTRSLALSYAPQIESPSIRAVHLATAAVLPMVFNPRLLHSLMGDECCGHFRECCLDRFLVSRHRRLMDAGCDVLMPLAAPIGTGHGPAIHALSVSCVKVRHKFS
jgi:hypothetical protein